MTRKTESRTRVFGRRFAQVGVAGALAAAPLALAVPAHAETDWDALAQCESSGNWDADTGNGFSGGLQFTPSTWQAFGGSGDAEDASRSEQIRVAERVKAAQGMEAWPTCSKKTGQTSDAPNSGSSGSSDSDDSDDSGSSSDDSSSSSDDSSSSDAEDVSTSSQQVTSSSKSDSSDSSKSDSSDSDSTSEESSQSHVVRSGETLSGLASRYGVDGGASALAERNGIDDPDLILVGQKLVLS